MSFSPVEELPPYSAHPAQPCNVAPDLTAAFSELHLLGNPAKPTPDQCLDHLKLLEAFHQLREDVATTDGLYGIHDSFVDAIIPTEEETERAQLLLKLREKRWAIYVTKAVWRYETWWKKTHLEDSSMPHPKQPVERLSELWEGPGSGSFQGGRFASAWSDGSRP
ncbi:MAG: hypothetical protein Q9201_006762 [Fulgogasparrea decipioides]